MGTLQGPDRARPPGRLETAGPQRQLGGAVHLKTTRDHIIQYSSQLKDHKIQCCKINENLETERETCITSLSLTGSPSQPGPYRAAILS